MTDIYQALYNVNNTFSSMFVIADMFFVVLTDHVNFVKADCSSVMIEQHKNICCMSKLDNDD